MSQQLGTTFLTGRCTHIDDIIVIIDEQLVYQTGTSIGFQPRSHIVARYDRRLVHGRRFGEVDAS